MAIAFSVTVDAAIRSREQIERIGFLLFFDAGGGIDRIFRGMVAGSSIVILSIVQVFAAPTGGDGCIVASVTTFPRRIRIFLIADILAAGATKKAKGGMTPRFGEDSGGGASDKVVLIVVHFVGLIMMASSMARRR